MKKFFAASLAAALAMSTAFSSFAAVKLEAPTVRWSSEKEALPEWTRIENASNKYLVEAYRNGNLHYTTRHSYPASYTDEWLDAHGYANRLKDSGIYTFRVMALGDGIDTLDSDWSEMSDEWSFTKASVTFGKPTNLRWEGTVACWDAPEIPEEYEAYLSGYEVAIFADGVETVSHNSVGLVDNRYDNADWMDDENVKEYTFNVRAISNTPSKIFHGDWAYGEDSHNQEETSDKISGIVDEILGSGSVADAPDILKENLGEVQTSMQTNDDVLKKIEELEAAYAEEQGITAGIVSDSADTGIDADDVKMVGAALNAKSANSTVTLNLKKPEKDEVVDAMMYKNTVQIDFTLEGAVETLKVPVRLTVPIPENVNPDFFHVLHYDQNGNYEDIIPLDINCEERTASFTVTHFSTFVLAEEGVDMSAVATPSNAEEFQKLANALPEDLSGLSAEESADVEAALWKLSEAIDQRSDVRTSLRKKDSEPTVAKLSSLFDLLGGGDMDVACEDPIENIDYDSLAFAPKFGAVTDLRAQLVEVSTPSNAHKTYSFILELYATDEDGTETKIDGSLRTPVKFYITMPDGFEDVASETDWFWYDEETGCIVVYDYNPGKYTIRLRSEYSGHSGGSSTSAPKGVRTKAVTPSPEGGKWSKTGSIWHYTFKNGSLAQNCWLCIDDNWYYFGDNGAMMTGWFQDSSNNRYYLTPAGEGTEGAMVTGWKQIGGTWYYFNEKGDGFRGAMLFNTTTPDGYELDKNGAWIQ